MGLPVEPILPAYGPNFKEPRHTANGVDCQIWDTFAPVVDFELSHETLEGRRGFTAITCCVPPTAKYPA
jgi:hypothetical protein